MILKDLPHIVIKMGISHQTENLKLHLAFRLTYLWYFLTII